MVGNMGTIRSEPSPLVEPQGQLEGALSLLRCVHETHYCTPSCDPSECFWRPVKCILKDRCLSLYELDDEVRPEIRIPIDANFQVRSERPALLELRIGILVESSRKAVKWRLKAPSLGAFVAWDTLLRRAKRPELSAGTRCEVCGKRFTFWKRLHHCKNCGRELCAACSPVKGYLPHLGYSDPQRLCLHCASKPNIKKTSEVTRSSELSHVELGPKVRCFCS